MREVDWPTVGVALLGLWQGFKEWRARRDQKRAAVELARRAIEAGSLADKLTRELTPVFDRAERIGRDFKRALDTDETARITRRAKER